MNKTDLIKQLHVTRRELLRAINENHSQELQSAFIIFDMALTNMQMYYNKERQNSINLFYVPSFNYSPYIEEIVDEEPETLKRRRNEN